MVLKYIFLVCRDQPIDLVFVVDGSIRIGKNNYASVMEWIKSIANQLRIE